MLVPGHTALGFTRCPGGTLSGLRLARGPGWMKEPCPPLTKCLLPQPHSSAVLASDRLTALFVWEVTAGLPVVQLTLQVSGLVPIHLNLPWILLRLRTTHQPCSAPLFAHTALTGTKGWRGTLVPVHLGSKRQETGREHSC